MKLLRRYAAFSWLVFGALDLPLFAATAQTKPTYHVSSSREEIVSKAKKEGKLRILTTMDDADTKANTAAFKKKYPFIDVHCTAKPRH
jgi:hypothetical protein